MKTYLHLSIICFTLLPSGTGARAWGEEVDFGRDVRPILAKHCITCHGPDPDARQAGLRGWTTKMVRGLIWVATKRSCQTNPTKAK